MRKLLEECIRECVREILLESPASDAYEQLVADSINLFKRKGVRALRAGGNTTLPDVMVTVGDITSFVEAKMSHTDNLANPRVYFDGSQWKTTYKTPAALYATELLNRSESAKAWLLDLAKFIGRKTYEGMKVPTTKGGMLDPDAVSYEEMKSFVKGGRGGYITMEPADIGQIVTTHYTVGKSEPAHYMQAADDFYKIGNKDPFGLSKFVPKGSPRIPLLKGTGDFKVRVGIRSSEPWYEVQAELKIKGLPESPYSVLSTSNKVNPFELLANSKRSTRK